MSPAHYPGRASSRGTTASTPPARDSHAGVTSVRELLRKIVAISDDTCCRFGDDDDGRDYFVLTKAIEASFVDNLNDAARREGFLRAMADLLCNCADEGLPGPEWDPIQVTEGAFLRARLAGTVGGASARGEQ